MSTHPVRRGGRPSLVPGLAALLLGVVAPLGGAQATAASENGLISVMETMGAGGTSVSAFNNSATASVGQPGTGSVASSTNYTIQPGVAWGQVALPSLLPIVTGVRPGTGGKTGGDVVEVFGFNFAAAGAGIPAVDFELAPATGVNVLGNTRIEVTAPAGLDTFTNPLPASKVAVTTGNGSFELPGAYLYEPALVVGNPAQLERRLRMRLHTDPGDFPLFLFGRSVPGFGIPITPFEGQLQIVINLQILTTSLQPAANGLASFEIDMPSNPPLVGATLEFQCFTLDDLTLTSGAWSNLLQVTIFP